MRDSEIKQMLKRDGKIYGLEMKDIFLKGVLSQKKKMA